MERSEEKTDQNDARQPWWAGLAALAAAAAWIWLLLSHPGAIFRSSVPAYRAAVLLTGLTTILMLVDLHRAHRNLWAGFDRLCLGLAMIPGVLLIAANLGAFLLLPPTRVLGNAGWGMILLFPATMLAASPLTRHRLKPGLVWFPALAGLALPLGQGLRVALQSDRAGLLCAMALAPAWLILGFVTRLPPRQRQSGRRRNRPV